LQEACDGRKASASVGETSTSKYISLRGLTALAVSSPKKFGDAAQANLSLLVQSVVLKVPFDADP
jgi:hypothetical protein